MILLYCQILHKKPYILQAIDIVNYTTASVLDKPESLNHTYHQNVLLED